jgi:hypothetical protein
LLIFRAANPWAQGVVGSNPIAPTNTLNQLSALLSVLASSCGENPRIPSRSFFRAT